MPARRAATVRGARHADGREVGVVACASSFFAQFDLFDAAGTDVLVDVVGLSWLAEVHGSAARALLHQVAGDAFKGAKSCMHASHIELWRWRRIMCV